MKRILAISACALLVSAALPAASISTSLSITGTVSTGASGFTVSGPATLSNIGSGTFAATVPMSGFTSANVTTPFTITLTGGAGTLTGNITFPISLLSGSSTSANGTIAFTGGTYGGGGISGSFPVTGSSTGSIATSLSITLTGSGTINTAGSGPGPGPTGPMITDVLDAGSYTHNIAQGSIFVVKGSGLSASGYTAMSFPLPTSSNNVSIRFTPLSGGTGTQAYLIYLYNQSGVNQLAAVLPSTVSPGAYNVTVTNGSNASSGFQVTVVQRKLGLITQDSTGSGLAVVQNYISASQLDIDRYTTGSVSGITISPATPGQTLIAWGTGMGPVPGGDNVAQQAYDFAKNGVNVQVLVGGMAITPFYAGAAPGLAGANQIDFTLPSNVPTGCAVSFQVSVNGQLSNATYISIAPNPGDTACVAPGLTTDQLQQLDQGGTYTTAGFSLAQITMTAPGFGSISTATAGGGFTKYTGFQLSGLLSSMAQFSMSTSGACTVIQSTTQGGVSVSGSGIGLDAGAVTLTGPSGSNLNAQALKQDPVTKSYSLLMGPGLPGAVSANIVAGTYTLNGAGGADVGTFNVSLGLGSPLTISGGLPTTVTRSAGLPLSWTGGNSSDMVEIIGGSTSMTGTGANAVTNSTMFICTTTAGTGGFTVSPSVLQQLPAVGSDGGILEVISGPAPAGFDASLKAGGSVHGTFGAFSGIGGQAAYQ